MYQERMLDLSEEYSKIYMGGIAATGRIFFLQAVKQGLMKVNSTQNFKLPKQQARIEDLESNEEQIKYLEKEELAYFLKTTQTEGLVMDLEVFITLSYTGK